MCVCVFQFLPQVILTLLFACSRLLVCTSRKNEVRHPMASSKFMFYVTDVCVKKFADPKI